LDDKAPNVPTVVQQLWEHLVTLSERLGSRHVFLLASGIAFNVILCVLPLMGLVIVVASLIVPFELARQSITDTIAGALPPTAQVQHLLNILLREVERVRGYALTASIVAGAVLLWTSSALLSSLRTALDAIFNIPSPRSFVWHKLRDLVLTLVLIALVVVMLLVTPMLSLLSANLGQIAPILETLHISGWLSFAVNLASTFVIMFLLYRIVPSKPQPVFIIVRASIVALFLWELARLVFTFYIEHARSLGAIYGTFSLLVVAALWIYYTALIVLVSAETAQYWWEHR
jgi:membrane protein